MRIISLFSGIAGLERGIVDGLARQGVPARILAQVELDPFCRSILARHYPGVDRSVIDVREFSRHTWRGDDPDIICGGFPCQDVSAAGKGAGLEGARSGLWTEFYRITTEFRPTWAVVENVASGKRRWLPHVRRDLHLLGYRTRAFQVSAFNVGAPHRRERVFVLAADPERVDAWPAPDTDRESPRGSVAEESVATIPGAAWPTPNPNGEGQLQPRGGERTEWRWSLNGGVWTIEPTVCGVAYGIPKRMDRLKSLGNGVVSQCAEPFGEMIAELT